MVAAVREVAIREIAVQDPAQTLDAVLAFIEDEEQSLPLDQVDGVLAPSRVWVTTLGFQFEMGLPGVRSDEEVSLYPEQVAISHTTSEPTIWKGPVNGVQLELRCPSVAVKGECAEGHHYAKGVICNREWCEEAVGRCGGIDGPAHQRRKARWMPKARKIGGMARFVLTAPPEVRGRYRTQKGLSELGTSAKRMFQRHGYKRGLRRWHFFGEDHPGHGLQGDGLPPYHPHLEVIVDGGYLSRKDLGAIKQSWANILKVPAYRINVYYEYVQPWDVRKKLHRISYALRPTFTHWEWDEPLAYGLIGFHNAQTWGSKADWDGPDLWEVPVDENKAESGIEALEEGRCPIDGTPIKWDGLIQARLLVEPDWEPLGGSYFRWNGRARDGPGVHDG